MNSACVMAKSLTKRDFELAMEKYSTVIELESRFAKAWANRGVLHLRGQSYEQAIEDSLQAMRLSGLNRGEPFNTIAVALRQSHQTDTEAVRIYGQAIDAAPRYYGAYENRGTLCLRNGEYPKALTDLTAAIALSDSDDVEVGKMSRVYRSITYCYLGDYVSAESDLIDAPAHPTLRNALFERAMQFENLSDDAMALRAYDRCIEMEPTTDAFYNRGCLHSRMGRRQASITDFESLLEISPGDEDAQRLLNALRAGAPIQLQ